MSKDFRKVLFQTRDYLDALVAESPTDVELVPISKIKLSELNDCFRWLRESARGEIELKDLKFDKSEIGVEREK